MNTYLLSLQRCGHNIAFFPWTSIGLCSTLWKYFSLRVEQTSWCSTCRSTVQFVVLFCISLTAMWTQQRLFFQPAASWLLVPYSLLIPYSLFLISFDGFQLNLENTSTTENESSLLSFKFRGQGHGDILSFHI
jgi:hypothetical protein